MSGSRSGTLGEMAEDNFQRILRKLLEGLPFRRKYAGFHHSRNKSVMERGIGGSFAESWERLEGVRIRDVRSSEREPPDLLADDSDGGLVGIELTEFVSQAAIEANEAGRFCYYAWRDEEAVAELQRIVQTKDAKPFAPTADSRPYRRRVLVIHTDEMVASPGAYRELLGRASFGPVTQLSDAFLLFSYHPAEGPTYPLIRLRLA